MSGRLLFVCAQGSSRALLAASLLQALAPDRWEVWSTPPADQQDQALAEQIVREHGGTMLSADRLVHPTSAMRWEEVIILCSGASDT